MGNFYQLSRQLVTLERDTLLLCVGLGYPHFIIDLPRFWLPFFSFPFDLYLVIMTSDPMDPKAAKLRSRVNDMFKS